MTTVICVACGREIAATESACPECGNASRLLNRYALREIIGRRGSGTTYRAFDERAGEAVVVKELVLRTTESLKEVELFEREASTLEALEHRSIPRFLDHCEYQRGKTNSLFTMHEYVAGTPLNRTVERLTPSQVASIIADVCEILCYLKSADPPVVHRDIKPANLIRRELDDGLTLVDFGAARVVAETLHASGSTITGTFGFMAPEQMLGHAEAASDVFGLGATALNLMTRRPPHELWSDHGRFDYERSQFDAGLVGLIDCMTSQEPAERPLPEDLLVSLRAFSAGNAGALAVFETQSALTTRKTGSSPRPALATLWQRGLGLIIVSIVVTVLSLGVLFEVGPGFAIYCFLPIGLLVAAAIERVVPVALLIGGPSVHGIVTGREIRGRTFRLTYRYSVDEQEYDGGRKVREAEYLQVEPGDELTVFYNPLNAEMSEPAVLRPRARALLD